MPGGVATGVSWQRSRVGGTKDLALGIQIKPDPKTIAADLRRFYPGYQPPLSAEQDIVLRMVAASAPGLCINPVQHGYGKSPRSHPSYTSPGGTRYQ